MKPSRSATFFTVTVMRARLVLAVGDGSGTWNTCTSGSPVVCMMSTQLAGVVKCTLPSAMLTSSAWARVAVPASSSAAARIVVWRNKLMPAPVDGRH
ncbi:hypothetical protein [Rhodanobacter sp. 115]|uniref:hypothetical protein n=1 Tax=Rhodanobacter sp. FW021-MT20 TaxID=1162282 RepID=UPI001ED96B2C|nr:hypothetical protein [Rhodanobacter sp. 115]